MQIGIDIEKYRLFLEQMEEQVRERTWSNLLENEGIIAQFYFSEEIWS